MIVIIWTVWGGRQEPISKHDDNNLTFPYPMVSARMPPYGALLAASLLTPQAAPKSLENGSVQLLRDK